VDHDADQEFLEGIFEHCLRVGKMAVLYVGLVSRIRSHCGVGPDVDDQQDWQYC